MHHIIADSNFRLQGLLSGRIALPSHKKSQDTGFKNSAMVLLLAVNDSPDILSVYILNNRFKNQNSYWRSKTGSGIV